jgi:hypothetical protein
MDDLTTQEQRETTRILDARTRALEAAKRMHEAYVEMNGAMQAITGSGLAGHVVGERLGWASAWESDEAIVKALHIDRALWQHLLERTLGELMSAEQRDKLTSDLYADRFPDLTHDNLMATLFEARASAPEVLTQSVYDMWRALHRGYRSNDAPSFGPRLIIEHALYSYTDVPRIGYQFRDRLYDLKRLGHLHGAVASMGTLHEEYDVLNELGLEFGVWRELGWCALKPFKKGTIHLRLDEDLRERLNRTLASAAGKRLHTS